MAENVAGNGRPSWTDFESVAVLRALAELRELLRKDPQGVPFDRIWVAQQREPDPADPARVAVVVTSW